MKYDSITKGLAGFLLLACFTVGCNKEEDTPPEEAQTLSFNSEEVLAVVPDGLKNSNDSYAQDCYSFIETAADMSSFIDNMEVPPDAQRSAKKSAYSTDTWQWTWNYGGESFTFYWTYEERNSKRYWTMEIQYGSGPRYDYISAWENSDGTQGEVTYNFGWAGIYSGESVEEYEFIYWRYTWNKDSSGAYHLEFKWDGDDAEYDYYTQYDVMINADGSGTIDYYMMGQLFYHMEWDILGNGSWVYYIDGEEFMSGLWVV
jgi:hypothetical protein